MICRGRTRAALAVSAMLVATGCSVLDLPKDQPAPARSVVIRCDDLGDSALRSSISRQELERICASLSPTPTPTPT